MRSASRQATAGYVTPFLTYVGIMALEHTFFPQSQFLYPLRAAVVAAIILVYSRPYISWRPSYPLATLGVGLAVFAIWIAPDVFFGYRHSWLFENVLTGQASSSIPPDLRRNIPFLAVRIFGSVVLVPIAEELFWRGWLMRRLINPDFQSVPLGQYAPLAFWIVAILFASEHGSYWEVGLAAGVIYNLWLVRTRSLADCIWAHAVTNGVLAIYVLVTGEWQYWL
jgi:CAAX prenyl protease-like protein